MMKEIENIKKILVLGESGTLVKCMLLDSIEEIKAANPKLSDEELVKAHGILQGQIAAINEAIKLEQEHEPTTED